MGQTDIYCEPIRILGLDFRHLDYEKALTLFERWIESREPHQVCIANVHTTITCLNDGELRDISNRSLITMDGLPLVWYANWVRKAGLQDRVCGPELMLRCLDRGRKRGWKHYFLGGRDRVVETLVEKMQERYPGVEISGYYSPPFRPLSAAEDRELVNRINTAQPDFLWVSLGAPKQEKWIAAHLQSIQVPVQIGVGAAFDFHSGHIKRAPVWMQKTGLEWFYRMIQDKRLVKRYLSTNPRFMFLFLRDFVLIRIFGKKQTI